MNERTSTWNLRGLIPLLLLFCLVTAPAMADPVYFPGTGHYYEYVNGLMDWQNALLLAETFEYQGQQGHLATVTSSEENDFIATTFGTGQGEFFAWLAGYEPEDDGIWLWAAGPEDGVQFSNYGQSTPPFFYTNWGPSEPNDHAQGEDFLAINLGAEFAGIVLAEWIDSPNPNPADPILGMIVEYEDIVSAVLPGDGNTASTRLAQLDAAPNPFNPTTTVSFVLPTSGPVQLAVFDIRGRLLRMLVEESLSAGTHIITWDGRDDVGQRVASGTYFCRLIASDVLITRKLVLVQ